ncbi:MAG: hypothetical protein BGO39_35325 [Chloroflexi bacterium 54-19]|nr:MAG: hypothetical protein BGO39_35325 [Chloroflexi bacterium 54-19]
MDRVGVAGVAAGGLARLGRADPRDLAEAHGRDRVPKDHVHKAPRVTARKAIMATVLKGMVPRATVMGRRDAVPRATARSRIGVRKARRAMVLRVTVTVPVGGSSKARGVRVRSRDAVPGVRVSVLALTRVLALASGAGVAAITTARTVTALVAGAAGALVPVSGVSDPVSEAGNTSSPKRTGLPSWNRPKAFWKNGWL